VRAKPITPNEASHLRQASAFAKKGARKNRAGTQALRVLVVAAALLGWLGVCSPALHDNHASSRLRTPRQDFNP
jgi:hypothetical protein